ncbi:outer membrane porin [Synechococcus sp. A15-62]|uniref:iron uptake porin n=1 Tax=Synechococcus sp. A15-62 TaxID=1050657 RepID=UPI0016457670|nr:iron uptake porin [Synechococcus sp. A15-62]QNJ01343.1 outer membrane porin [Synechococcus sp. A15-62]
MKLFQQLLVAPAALGLLASGANAAELNINGVSDYAASADQVTSVTQFSDVYPTDWAYQALANLVETYGCVAGYPNGTFRGNRAMTRYEAAALLNACLDRITEVTDELRRLLKEFETELAILKGRVDGLEARVGELEATQFSTTTKLKGYTAWVMGAQDGIEGSEALTLNYDLRLKLATSFTGKDELTTVLRSGNFDNSIFGTGLTFVETAMSSGDTVKIGRLFYTFPVGDSLSVTAGPIVRTDDASMYAGYATFYPSDLLLDFFTYGGAPTTNNLAYTGSGLGAVYTFGDSGFKLSGNYVAVDGNDSSVGIGTDAGTTTSSWQLFYEGEVFEGSFLAQLGYSYEQNAGLAIGTAATTADRHGYSVAAAWAPGEAGIIPSISTGYSFADVEDESEDINSWYVGLEWSDVFMEGNSLGAAIGEAPSWDDAEGNLMWEAFYSFAVSDNITITPAIFGIYDEDSVDDEVFGGIVKTTFTF